MADLTAKANRYLHKLCVEIPDRRVGSPENRSATDFFAEVASNYGFEVEQPEFECMDWRGGEVELVAGGVRLEALPSPYSMGCRVEAPLTHAGSVGELEAVDSRGKILLLHGEIAREQLMPKNFVFYNPEVHQHIYRLLEAKAPLAIISATGRNPELAGGMYPFPLIEDGDFDIPSVYMRDVDGERLVEHTGEVISLVSRAERIPARGCNVVARKGNAASRLVFCAHIDSKPHTPGALDNATGCVALLLLAELLRDYEDEMGIEIVALNGEDYYAASGQMLYLGMNEGKMEAIRLAVNLDGAGYKHGRTAYSLYECPEGMSAAIHKAFAGRDEMVAGEAWYQSDHMIFVMSGRPAIAITSQHFVELFTDITHTPKDTPELADASKLVAIAEALKALAVGMR